MRTQTPSKRYLVGLAAAAIWLTSAGTAFVLPGLWLIDTSTAGVLFVAAAIVAVSQIAISILTIRQIVRLPVKRLPMTGEERTSYRRFWLVVIAEVIGFLLAARVCSALGRMEFFVPACIAIVGLHFAALAPILRVPRCYFLGIVFCGSVAVTLTLFPAGARIGNAVAWIAVPSFICAPAAWATAAANLREARQFVRESRSAAAA